MCILIIIVFTLIGSVAFYGDYEEDERKRDYKKYEEIVNANRDTFKNALL